MDYHRRCEMDCVETSKWIFSDHPIDVFIEIAVDLHTDEALPVLVKCAYYFSDQCIPKI